MKMKNDNEKIKHNSPKGNEFFSQFSKEELLKTKALADVIKGELEITKKYTNEEKESDRFELREMLGLYDDEPVGLVPYENSDYVLRINFGRVPVSLTPDDFEKLLQRIGDAFRFFDPTTTPYNPANKDESYYVGITSKENFEFFYKQLGGKVDEIKLLIIKNVHLDANNFLLEFNNGEEIIPFKSKKHTEPLEKETKLFKLLFHLWDFRWEIKNGKITRKGDFVILENIQKSTKCPTEGATEKLIRRLDALFKKKLVPIEIVRTSGKYRLLIHLT